MESVNGVIVARTELSGVVYMINRIGPKTEPRGTPQVMLVDAEWFPFRSIEKVRDDR